MDTTAESQKQTKLDAFLLKRNSVNASHGAKSLSGENHGPNRAESLEKSEQIRVIQNGFAASEESDFKSPKEPLESANSSLQSTNTISDASGGNNAIEIGSVSPQPCQSPPLKRKFDTSIAIDNEATHTIPEAGALEKSDTKRSKPQASNDKSIEISPAPAENKAETEENSVSQEFTSAATETPLLASEPESATPTSDHSQPEKLTKRQEERLAKQKLREVERLERERKKEEERMQRQEEREKKELERKQKREALEKEKQQKREQEQLRKEQRRLKIEEEKKAKELERLAKEKERKQKEEERRRAEEAKERNQMKISNFFTVKSAAKEKSSSSSVSTVNAETKAAPKLEVTNNTKEVSSQNSYREDFLPFFQKSNVLLASNAPLSPDLLATAMSKFDTEIGNDKCSPDISHILKSFDAKPPKIFTNSQQMVDALNSSQMTESVLYDLVRNLPPIKYLQFYENAKPPYVGTWCSDKHIATKVPPACPLDMSVTGFDYNYDSDLDWQEGDEGEEEDIDDLDEGDEEEEDAEDDEMEDFVEASETNKRGHIGPLQSVCIWNDGTRNELFDGLKYERLHWDIEFPIDPFKDYWSVKKEPKEQESPIKTETKQTSSSQQVHLVVPVKLAPEKSQAPNVLTPQKPVIKDEKVVQSLVDFIKKNSDFSIGTLSELAKKEFKVFTKSILKHTIQEIAVYNKKKSQWEIKGENSG
ncbi:hypothetical protein OY671_002380 [Metschnikowia pulcherrima]|nr:hypothetical protein OY671_002380 [Metschnikowia pulcherrima]